MPPYARILILTLCCALLPALSCTASRAQVPSRATLASPNTVRPFKGFVILELRIPMKAAGSRGLQALLVRPDEPGPHPLAIITHGTNNSAKVRLARSPRFQLPIAMEFARRGWTAVIVMRRNNGDSGGRFAEFPGICDREGYVAVGKAASDDLRAAITYLSTLPEVDARRIISLGISGGGFATVALTSDPPPGLVAAMNFAGGSWPFPNASACKNNLVSAFRFYGSQSRIPMLWVYSENDIVFWPEIAQQFYTAFTDAGGKARFIQAPPFEDNGHNLLGAKGIPIWTAYVDDFLKSQKLQLRSVLLPIPPPALLSRISPPPELSTSFIPYFEEYLAAQNEKAFAVSPDGAAGYSSGFHTVEDAKKSALELCQKNGAKCRVAIVNNSPVHLLPN